MRPSSVFCPASSPGSCPGIGDVTIRHLSKRGSAFVAAVLSAIWMLSGNAYGWSCKTHLFIAREAGVADPQTACYPDLWKKENDALLGPHHWHNAAPDAVVDAEYIDRFQIKEESFIRLGGTSLKPVKIKVPDPAGVLYWKIVDTFRMLQDSRGWEYEYYVSTIAHYVGDLSQPLHNFPYGSDPAGNGRSYPEQGIWAKKMHQEFDQTLDTSLPLSGDEAGRFAGMIKPPAIVSVDDLKKEISRIANAAIALANRCYTEKRVLTREEALRQAAMSVALLKAIGESTRSR